MSRSSAVGRGHDTDFVTVVYPLQDAFFGGRQIPNEIKPALNGSDLLINTHNGDLALRSVRVIGYDRQDHVDWSHMLRIDEITSSSPGGVLLFPRAWPSQIHASLKDDALIDRPSATNFRSAIIRTKSWPKARAG
ncbi:MAG: hypothetical protein WDO13_00595 [Verrucomicrobiota bacterium]